MNSITAISSPERLSFTRLVEALTTLSSLRPHRARRVDRENERDRHLFAAEELDLLRDLVFGYREVALLQVHRRLVRGIDDRNVEQHQVGAEVYGCRRPSAGVSSLGCCRFREFRFIGRLLTGARQGRRLERRQKQTELCTMVRKANLPDGNFIIEFYSAVGYLKTRTPTLGMPRDRSPLPKERAEGQFLRAYSFGGYFLND